MNKRTLALGFYHPTALFTSIDEHILELADKAESLRKAAIAKAKGETVETRS